MSKRLVAAALSVPLGLAGCSGTPTPVSSGTRPAVTPADPDAAPLIGMSREEVAERFGAALLTIREGDMTKLQWREEKEGCVLDLFLAPAKGRDRVTFAEARDRQGRAVPLQSCANRLATR